jgi:predicted ATPase/transcriptional regulator with XRE-family HTH domain
VTSFAEVLREFREERSLTQEELAERAGITVKAVGALERGERRRPYPHTVRALADGLGLDDSQRARLVASVPGRTRPPVADRVDGPVGGPAADPVTALPAPPVAMVGRAAELQEVAALLGDPATRVVTLTGPGGVGKTTLALAVAHAAAAGFPGGVTQVELAGTDDAAAVLPSVAAALGVPEAGFTGTAAGLALYLIGRRVLLLLDNLEQLLDVAPDLAELVAHCPDLVVLATSRAPLRIRAEREVRVEPLDHDTAVRLFRDRAAAAGGRLVGGSEEDAAVAELCRRLDGLPLALELAASATALLRPAALLARLDSALDDGPRDLPERQRSMAATLAWSLDLLEPPAQALLARLSVFPDGFSLAGAEAVGGDGTLPLLRVLLDHSLVSRGPDVHGTERFRLLVPVRQYAAARLDPAERGEVVEGLSDLALDLARELEADLRGASLAAGLDLVEADLATVRLALGHLVDSGRFDDAGELVWRLWLFLALRGHAREGLRWVARLADRPLTDLGRASRLTAAAGFDYLVGDIDALREHADAALVLARRLDHPEVATEAAVLAGSGALFAGDLTAAADRLAWAAPPDADVDIAWATAHRRIAEGQLALLAGEADTADAVLRDAERLARDLGNPFTLATVLNIRAILTELRDEHVLSAQLLTEAAELSADAAIGWTLAYTLPALAGVAVRLGEPETGARLFGASASYSAEHSVATNFQASRALADHNLTTARDQLGEAAFRAAWDAGRDTTPAGVVELARGLSRRGPG